MKSTQLITIFALIFFLVSWGIAHMRSLSQCWVQFSVGQLGISAVSDHQGWGVVLSQQFFLHTEVSTNGGTALR